MIVTVRMAFEIRGELVERVEIPDDADPESVRAQRIDSWVRDAAMTQSDVLSRLNRPGEDRGPEGPHPRRFVGRINIAGAEGEVG